MYTHTHSINRSGEIVQHGFVKNGMYWVAEFTGRDGHISACLLIPLEEVSKGEIAAVQRYHKSCSIFGWWFGT